VIALRGVRPLAGQRHGQAAVSKLRDGPPDDVQRHTALLSQIAFFQQPRTRPARPRIESRCDGNGQPGLHVPGTTGAWVELGRGHAPTYGGDKRAACPRRPPEEIMFKAIDRAAVGYAPTVRVKRRTLTALTLFSAVAGVILTKWSSYGVASLYGFAVFAILGTKLFLSLLPARRWRSPNPHARVGAVVTIYNEDPELLRGCLDSLLRQTFPLTSIFVIDDASADLAAYDLACQYAARDRRILVRRQPVNMGKREGLAVGFRAMADQVDVFLCTDSDSRLEPNAVYEGMRPFGSRRITATTGLVLPSNYGRNALTRLQDVRYANAFLGERAAYSRFGSVLCVCGILAFYRANVALHHLDDFVNQRFLGQPATIGDDRRMTNYCLTAGRVVFVESAIAHTAVPERFSHYVRQQARWGRSFFRESLWVLAKFRPTRAAWWLTLLELTQWMVFSTILVYFVIVHPLLTGQLLIMQYLLFVGLLALARAVRYFDVRRVDQPVWSRLVTFAVAPLYGYLNLLVMLPLRFYSLITLRIVKWGTRKHVEVTAEGTRMDKTTSGRYRLVDTAPGRYRLKAT
jgi:hyaluronan synthase